MKFWLLWGFDGLVAGVIVFFFLTGLLDGSVSSFNIKLWLLLLLFVAGVMVGSILLNSYGSAAAARTVLLLLAVPGLIAVLFIVAMIVLKPKWN